jgi:hypothetical protein
VLTGLLVGSAVTVLLVAYPALKPWPLHAGIYGLVLNLVALVAISALGRPGNPAAADAFLSVASGRGRSATGPV